MAADLETGVESGEDFWRGQQEVEEVDCRSLHAACAALAKPGHHLHPACIAFETLAWLFCTAPL